MPTALSHAIVPLAVGLGLGSRVIPSRLLLAGVVAAVVPDLDVIAFRAGIAYTDVLGHRGFTHSLAVALLAGAVAAGFARYLRCSRPGALLFITVCMVSHGLLDMCTDAGQGVALLWPWSGERLFAPWRFIDASPLGLGRLLGGRGLEVMRSEVVGVWVPAAAACMLAFLARRACARKKGNR